MVTGSILAMSEKTMIEKTIRKDFYLHIIKHRKKHT